MRNANDGIWLKTRFPNSDGEIEQQLVDLFPRWNFKLPVEKPDWGTEAVLPS